MAGSLTLKTIIPSVTRTPTIIFLGPSLSCLSDTLEHKTPTKITEIRLQDLNIMTTGKLVR